MSDAKALIQANGTIAPCRFVKLDPSASFSAIQAGAGDRTFGISVDATIDPPLSGASTAAANAGDQLEYYTPGEVCRLELGTGGCTAGDLLKPDANGKGIAGVAATQFYGAEALETGVAGEFVNVMVRQATA
jgi:hypothetical protein